MVYINAFRDAFSLDELLNFSPSLDIYIEIIRLPQRVSDTDGYADIMQGLLGCFGGNDRFFGESGDKFAVSQAGQDAPSIINHVLS